jgi:hypothetical protein
MTALDRRRARIREHLPKIIALARHRLDMAEIAVGTPDPESALPAIRSARKELGLGLALLSPRSRAGARS